MSSNDPSTLGNALKLTAALGLAFSGAHAQEAAPVKKKTAETANSEEMPEVVVTGQQAGSPYKADRVESVKYTEPLLDIPQTINVVPEAVIQQQNATTLRDVLRNVPGISMQAGEGGGGPGGDFLSIRGFQARNDIFIDGFRDFGGYSRDPFNTEQVEVVKGPASNYTGRGSTGGSVNLSSKTPQLDPFYRANTSFGTDEFKRFTIDINQPLSFGSAPAPAPAPTPDGKAIADGKSAGKNSVPAEAVTAHGPGIAFRLNGMWSEGETPGRTDVEFRKWGIAPSLAFGLGTDTRLILSYFHLEEDGTPDYGIPWVPANTVNPVTGAITPGQRVLPPSAANEPSPVDFGNFYGLKNRDFVITRTDLGTVTLEHDFTDSVSVNNSFRYGNTSRDQVTSAPRYIATATDPAVAVNAQFQSRDQTDEIFGDNLAFEINLETWGIQHDIATGADYAHEKAKNHVRVQSGPAIYPTDLFNPDPSRPYFGHITRTGGYTEAESDSVGVYLFDTLKFNEHWQLSGGLRWDYYGSDYEQKTVNPTTGAVTLLNLSRVDRMFSYRAALTYKPVENGAIYAAFGTSFNPSAEGAVSLSPISIANANLDPEENDTYEIGTKWDIFDGRLALTAALFRTDKTNARVTDPTNDTQQVLDGEQHVQGVELGVSGEIVEGWNVFAGYTYLDSEVDKSTDPTQVGNELPQTPDQSFNLWTTYEFPFGLTVGGGAQYSGTRFNNTSSLNRRESDQYWLFDTMASYAITKNITVQANVYNIFDEQYIDRLGGGHFVPGAGRSATVSVNFSF
ncbi:MAG TPA: TonB-dependent receptor [Chthoniobacterales bacterium]